MNSLKTASGAVPRTRISRLMNIVIKDRWLYMMALPGILYFIIFKYLPMWGILIAFKDYQPYIGFFASKWVGFKWFNMLFNDPMFFKLLRNTAFLAIYNLVFYFPLPIFLALMLNEIRSSVYKRFIQTLVYIPHFMSWVVVIGISYVIFTTENGIINELIVRAGGQKINFLMNSSYFRALITGQIIWKECGWGTIIFLAAISGIDIQLYESAWMDGASRWQQLWHITLPSIRSTIVILVILRLGHFLDVGFEQIFLMISPTTREIGEVFETYVYDMGLIRGRYGFSTAVGLFKAVVGLVLVFSSNKLAKKVGEEGIF